MTAAIERFIVVALEESLNMFSEVEHQSTARTPDLAVLDGVLCPGSDAAISVRDEGLLRGDGAFELIRVYGGRAFALDEHLGRLAASCSGLRLDHDGEAVRADVEQLLSDGAGIDCDLRIVLTRGGRRILLLEPQRRYEARARLGFVTYSPSGVLDGLKSISYAANMLATRLARERGHDEALFVTLSGDVLEAPTASFFWVGADGVVRTPPLDLGILASITRTVLIKLAEAEETRCRKHDALECREAFLASTTREVQPVVAIEGHLLGGAPGRRTRELMRAYREHVNKHD